jgi:hypothetical protein
MKRSTRIGIGAAIIVVLVIGLVVASRGREGICIDGVPYPHWFVKAGCAPDASIPGIGRVKSLVKRCYDNYNHCGSKSGNARTSCLNGCKNWANKTTCDHLSFVTKDQC